MISQLVNISFGGWYKGFKLHHGYTGNSVNRVATKSQRTLASGVCKNKYSLALFFIKTVQIWLEWTRKIFFGTNISTMSKLNYK